MKSLLLVKLFITFVIVTPTFAQSDFGCDGDNPYPYSAESALLNKALSGTFSCAYDGKKLSAKLDEFAVYRCIDSPTYLRLSFGKNAIVVSSLVSTGENSFRAISYQLPELTGMPNQMDCEFESQLRIRK